MSKQANKNLVYAINTIAVVAVVLGLGYVFYIVTAKPEASEKPAAKNSYPPLVIGGSGPGIPENTSSFQGMYTRIAPTNAVTKPAEKEYDYPSEPTTGREYAEQWRDFWLLGVKHFQSRDIDEEEKNALSEWAEDVIEVIGTRFTRKPYELRDRADELRRKYDEIDSDPFLLLLRAKIAFLTSAFEDQFVYSQKSVQGFQKSDYPARFPVSAYATYHIAIGNTGRRSQGLFIINEYIDATLYWLENDFRANVWQQRIVYQSLATLMDSTSSPDLPKLDRMIDRLESGGHLPKWLRLMFNGIVCKRKAWDARGTGYAHTVTEEGWKTFAKMEKLSIGYVEKATRLCPSFPEATTLMIAFGRTGNSKTGFQEWFDKTVDAQFDYGKAYEEVLYSLYPRWHGSIEEMMEFGRKCLDTERFDTCVPAFYMESFFAAVKISSPERQQQMMADPQIKKQLIRCMKGYSAQNEPVYLHVQKYETNYFPTLLAIFADRAGQFQLARETFEKIGDNPNTVVLDQLAEMKRPMRLRSRAYARSGEFAEEAKKLADLVGMKLGDQSENREEIGKLLDEVLAKSSGAELESITYFSEYKKFFDAETAFDKGEWADVEFDNNWWHCPDFTQLKCLNPQTLEVNNLKGEWSYQIRHAMRFPLAKSIEWEQDYLSQNYQADSIRNDFNDVNACGLVVAKQGNSSLQIGISPARYELMLISQSGSGDYQMYRVHLKGERKPNQSKYKIRVDVAPKFMDVYVDGELALSSRNEQIVPIDRLRIENISNGPDRGLVRFSNLRIKRWDQNPPWEAEKYLDHYSELVKLEPENPVHWYRLGMAQHMEEELDQAQASYEKAVEAGMDQGKVATLLGDIHDRKGEFQQANELYLAAVEYAAKFKPLRVQDFQNSSVEASLRIHPTRTIYSIAGARYRWNQLSHPDESVRDAFAQTMKRIPDGQWETNVPWSYYKVKAQSLAVRGRFEAAEKLARQISEKFNNADSEVDAQIKQFKESKVFTVSVDDEGYKPYYLSTPDLLIFETLQSTLDRVGQNLKVPELDRIR
jgi:tetratricopeptide (TPR) repeat protein